MQRPGRQLAEWARAARSWWGALSLARAIPRLQDRSALRDLNALADITSAASAGDWQAGSQRVLDTLVEKGYARCALLVARRDGGQLETLGWARRTGAALPDPAADPELRQLVAGGRLETGGGRAVIPIETDEGPLGAILLVGPEWNGPLAPGRLAFLRTAASLTAWALTGLLAFQRQLALSQRDGLTGLANHRHFHHLLAAALAQTYLDGEPLFLLLLDVDRFKAINDTFGHLFGDLVLREIAQLVRRSVPERAIVARYGGEEFAVALPGCNQSDAMQLAERLRRQVEGHSVVEFTTGRRVAVSVSIGGAGHRLGQGKERLMTRADEALYASKGTGRNRVTWAEDDEEEHRAARPVSSQAGG